MAVDWAQVTEAISNIILAGAGIIGAGVAVMGLNTWKKQLRGQVEFDLARRTLRTIYQYRDAMHGVRNPAMFGFEMQAPPEEKAKTMNRAQIDFYGRQKAYINRWDRVKEVRANLYPDLIETEALWGTEIKDAFAGAIRLENRLWLRLTHQLEIENPDTRPEDREAVRELIDRKNDILYDIGDEDKFTEEFNAVIDNISAMLKTHLQR